MKKNQGSNNILNRQLSGAKENKKNVGIIAGQIGVILLMIFVLAQCEVFTNDSGKIPTRDVGITSMEAPSSVTKGESTQFTISIKNFGNEVVNDSLNIILTDSTDRNNIDRRSVNKLIPDSTRTVVFSWNTGEASSGEHQITAVHDFEDNNTSNDTSSVILMINEPAVNDMSVSEINLPSSATHGDEIDIEVTVRNNGDETISENVNVTLQDLTDENTIGTREISELEAGASTTLTYSWNTENASTGNHELQASHSYNDDNADNDAASATITINEPAENDLAVTQVDAPSSATKGDEVEIDVTVENTGEQSLDEEVTITLEDLTEEVTIGTQNIRSLDAGATTTLTYSWDTGEASAGDHELQASHSYNDDNADNNTVSATLTISEPAENDLAVTQVDAPSSATHGDEVEIDVTVENTGDQSIDGDVTVTLEDQTEEVTIGTQTFSGLDAGATTTLTYSWDTGEASTGEHDLKATHDFEDDNNNNNSASADITISEQEENDIAIARVNAPSSAEQGEEIDVEVTVENTGNQPINEEINIELQDQTDGVTIGTQTISGLAEENSETLTFTWETGDASTGEHEIEASHSFDDDNAGNNTGSTSVTINEPTIIDVGISGVDAPSSTVQGDNVTFTLTVENQGNSDVTETFSLALDNETSGENINNQSITSLSAGSTTERTFIWDTDGAEIGTHTLIASHNLDDDNSSNNSESTTVTVEEPADIAITGVIAESATVIQGEVVNVDVTLENSGDQTAENFSVTLEDQTDGNTIDTQSGNTLEAGSSTTLTFSWDTEGASPGDHTLLASNSISDDTGSETITINEAVTDIAITGISAPSSAVQGDNINIDITVENVGNQPVNEDIGVILQDITAGEPVNSQNFNGLEPGASNTVTFTWNTSDATTGDHELQANHSVDDDNGSNDSESTIVTVEAPADLAINGVNATPSSATQGEIVSVDVTIENTGDQTAENFSVTLDDQTDGNTIDTQSGNTLEAGSSTTLTFNWNTEGASTGDHTLLASNSISDDTGSETVTINEAVTDIAITGISAPSSAVQGDNINVDVTVENNGNQTVEEDISVSLDDQTDGMNINTQNINGLEPGATANLTYSWNTGDASIGQHEISASHNFNDDNTENDSENTTVTIEEPLEVQTIEPNSMEKGSSIEVTISGSGFQSGAEVTIENGSDGKGPDPEVSDVEVNDSETITATVTASDNGPDEDRVWDVRVTNPDNSTAVLENGFTVTTSSNDG